MNNKIRRARLNKEIEQLRHEIRMGKLELKYNPYVEDHPGQKRQLKKWGDMLAQALADKAKLK